MAGTLQALATPDLTTPFPDFEFFVFVVGHLGIGLAAMYLARGPGQPSLLSVLGPWPWYLLSAAGVAIVLFAVLDAPFRFRDRPPHRTLVSRT